MDNTQYTPEVPQEVEGASNLTLEDLTIGANPNAILTTYEQSLRTELVVNVQSKINEVDEIVSAVNDGWQGSSRDAFLKDFENARARICTELDREFQEVHHQLIGLAQAYTSIDSSVYSSDGDYTSAE